MNPPEVEYVAPTLEAEESKKCVMKPSHVPVWLNYLPLVYIMIGLSLKYRPYEFNNIFRIFW